MMLLFRGEEVDIKKEMFEFVLSADVGGRGRMLRVRNDNVGLIK